MRPRAPLPVLFSLFAAALTAPGALPAQDPPPISVEPEPEPEPEPDLERITPGALVLVLVGAPRRDVLCEALRIELAGRGLGVEADEAPFGDDSGARALAAAATAQQRGARAAIWIEPATEGSVLPSLSAIDPVSGHIHFAPLPRPSRTVVPRVFAVVAASLLDELAEAPVPAEPEPEPEQAPAPVVVAPPPAVSVGLRTAITPRTGRPGVGIDFVPYLGTSLWTRGRGVRWLSLNAIGGISEGIEGLELSGVVGIASSHVRGAQLAGVSAIDGGDLRGVQASGVYGHAGGALNGLQLAGVAALALGPVEGGQLAGVAATSGGPVHGTQAAGVATWAGGDVRGLQIAGVANVARGDVRGVQIGLVNVATGDANVQIGLVNVSRRARAPIGLVNVMRGGLIELEVTGSDSGFLTAGLLHSGGGLQVQARAGGRPSMSDLGALAQFGGGLGGNFPVGEQLFVLADLTCDWVMIVEDAGRGGVLSAARLGGGVRVGDRLSLVGALTYSVLSTDAAELRDLGLVGPKGFREASGGWSVQGWPGFLLGARIR